MTPEQFQQHADAGHTRIPVVREVLSDLDTPLHFVTAVIDIVRLGGIKKLSLQTASEN